MFDMKEEDYQYNEDPFVRLNIENGLRALKLLSDGQEEVSNAMCRKELIDLGGTEEIAFLWGKRGHKTNAGRYKGGEGFGLLDKWGDGLPSQSPY